jgi:hypothetical protein
MRRFKIAGPLLVLWVGALSSCGTNSPPQIVEITGRLVSPNGNEGAAVIEIDGLVSPVIYGENAGDEFHPGSVGGMHRVVIVKSEPGEISFTLFLNGTAELPTATVIEVAGPDDQIRTSLDGYRVEFGS